MLFRNLAQSKTDLIYIWLYVSSVDFCADGFASGFKNELAGVNVLFMQSDGGLTPMESFNGSRAILSGNFPLRVFLYHSTYLPCSLVLSLFI